MKRFALLGLLALSLFGVHVTTPDTASAAYECPSWTTYCRKASQCDSYCGGAGLGACSNGCCACRA